MLCPISSKPCKALWEEPAVTAGISVQIQRRGYQITGELPETLGSSPCACKEITVIFPKKTSGDSTSNLSVTPSNSDTNSSCTKYRGWCFAASHLSLLTVIHQQFPKVQIGN